MESKSINKNTEGTDMKATITYQVNGNIMEAVFTGNEYSVKTAIEAIDERSDFFIDGYSFTFDDGTEAGNNGQNASAYMYEVLSDRG